MESISPKYLEGGLICRGLLLSGKTVCLRRSCYGTVRSVMPCFAVNAATESSISRRRIGRLTGRFSIQRCGFLPIPNRLPVNFRVSGVRLDEAFDRGVSAFSIDCQTHKHGRFTFLVGLVPPNVKQQAESCPFHKYTELRVTKLVSQVSYVKRWIAANRCKSICYE